MGIHLTDILLFGKAVESSVDSGTFRIYRRNILRWGAISHAVDVVVHGVSPLSLPDAVADGLKYVKAFGDCENRNLPEGYQELEYIEGNNNAQYINTGIVPTSSMNMYLKAQIASVVVDTEMSMFLGARDISGQYGLFLNANNTSIGLDFFQANSRWTENNTRTNGDVIEFSVNNALAEIKVNGTSLGTHQFTPDDTTQYPLFLNALNNIGEPFSNVSSNINRIYRFTIEGICDMRPARRLSDGVLGMYDTIRKRFFANAGTGTFIAGAVVALPEGYTKLGFLQTTKTPSQCYFDTGKNFNSNYTYEVSFMKGGNANAVMGARVGAYNAKGNFAVTYVTQTAVYSSTSSASVPVDMGDTTLDEKHTVRYCQRDSLLTWDGTDKWRSGWINSESIPYNMYLFAMNQADTVQGSRSGYLRIYTYKVYDGNGILIQDLVPAIRNSDNAMGLYDTVADEFLLAKGSSVEFTASPVYTPTPTAPQDIWCNNGAIKAIRPIKYLESTGTQYIDTGVIPNQDTSVELDGSLDGYGIIFGVRTAPLVDISTIQGTSTGYWAMGYNTSADAIGTKDSNRHVWFKDKNKQYMDGELKNNYTYANFTAMGNAYLFAYNNNGAVGYVINGRVRVYSCKIWDGDTLVRDFIPALDMNNIPCLYDKVEGKCYYNGGTGQFIAGYLPAEYEEMEYIQGASNVQYINTNIVPTYNSTIYAKAQLVTDEQTTNVFFFGSRISNTGGTGASASWAPTTLNFDWFGASSSDRYSVDATRTTGDILEWNIANSVLTMKKNGTVIGSKTFSTSGTDTQPIYINALNNAGSVVSNNNAVIRFYRFTVAGVCDMIPARKRSNGHIGMYDLVRRQFFENAGEGQFTVGKLPILPETYTQLDYIESTGTQYLNTGVANNQVASYDITVQATQAPETGRAFLVFGSRNSATVANITSTLTPTNACSDFGDYNSTRLNPTIDFPLHKLRFVNSATSRTITDLDAGTVYTSTSAYTGTFSGSTTLRIGQVTTGGATTWDNFVGKIFECKVYQNDVLVKYLIPAKRNSDGVVGMYDVTNDVFHTNEGTGDFEYGSEIPDSRESYYYVDGDVETIATKAGGSTLSTATCENLLGIGSTQDVQEILTGSITRKVGVLVLNGSETWIDFDHQHQMYQMPIPDTTTPTVPTNIVCSHFTSDLGSLANMPNNSGKVSAANTFPGSAVLMIKKTDVGGLSQWMSFLRSQYDAGTPVVVIYTLSADETESVAGQTLTVSAGNNTAEIIQASIDDLELEMKYTKTNN